MSKGAYKLFKRSYEHDLASLMPQSLMLAKDAADRIPSFRSRIIDVMLALKLEAPVEQWEEVAMWELGTILQDFNGVGTILSDLQVKLSRRVEKRWRIEIKRLNHIDDLRKQMQDEKAERDRIGIEQWKRIGVETKERRSKR